MKDYEKQEKRIKELKASGTSKKKAETKQKEALTRLSFTRLAPDTELAGYPAGYPAE